MDAAYKIFLASIKVGDKVIIENSSRGIIDYCASVHRISKTMIFVDSGLNENRFYLKDGLQVGSKTRQTTTKLREARPGEEDFLASESERIRMAYRLSTFNFTKLSKETLESLERIINTCG